MRHYHEIFQTITRNYYVIRVRLHAPLIVKNNITIYKTLNKRTLKLKNQQRGN